MVLHLPDQIEDDNCEKFLQLIDDWKQQERILGKRGAAGAPDLAVPVARIEGEPQLALTTQVNAESLAVSTQVGFAAIGQELVSMGGIINMPVKGHRVFRWQNRVCGWQREVAERRR